MNNTYKVNEEAAKKIAERVYDNGTTVINRNDLEEMFPALKESEDERIRKAIIEHFAGSHSSMYPYKGFTKEQIIAWLEKQGEQKPADKVEPKFKVGDEIKTANEESLAITKIDEKGYWSEDLFICGFDDAAKWELVEQKPAWSEEDEKILDRVITNYESGYLPSVEKRDEIIEKLKSLKERYTWKPSDEQMLALKHASNDCSIAFADMKILAALYEQLKALHRYEQDT